jgi:hypothetical protein
MSNNFNNIIVLAAKVPGIVVSGLIMGAIGALGFTSVVQSIFVFIVTVLILVEFIKLAGEKKNYSSWLRANVIILIGLVLGVGGVAFNLITQSLGISYSTVIILMCSLHQWLPILLEKETNNQENVNLLSTEGRENIF